MDPESLEGITSDQALQVLLPHIQEVATHLRRHGENSLNWLKMSPDWEKVYRNVWPDNYTGQVGGIVMTFAVEDWSTWGPPGLRGSVARVLSLSYIEVKTANALAADGKRYQADNPILTLPELVARAIAHGFFEGLVNPRHMKATGDWAFVQLVGREGADVSSIYPGLV